MIAAFQCTCLLEESKVWQLRRDEIARLKGEGVTLLSHFCLLLPFLLFVWQ